MTKNPLTTAKHIASDLLRDAKAAGWKRAKLELRPDGSILLDANMDNPESPDDFINTNLRMGND